jgi:hypothetical protein
MVVKNKKASFNHAQLAIKQQHFVDRNDDGL